MPATRLQYIVMPTDSLDSIYSLPINSRREEIVASVHNNQVTIITAETGAGKSTQVPQYLAEAGYTKVIVTQPRILAARNLSMRVRQEYSWRTGRDSTQLVGYRTAHEQDDSPGRTGNIKTGGRGILYRECRCRQPSYLLQRNARQ